MILTRYTCNGKGLFRSMSLLDDVDVNFADEQDIFDAERDLDEFLPVPEACTKDGIKCYFTEKGVKRFYESIDTIIFYMEQYIGNTEKTVIEYTGPVIYQDEYQVVLAA